MATPLPHQYWIKQDGQWQGNHHNTVYQVGASRLSVSHGFKTTTYSRTLEWIVEASEAAAMLAALHALDFQNVYEFTCNTVGLTRVYVVGAPTYTEAKSGLKVRISLPVERRV